MEVIFTPRECEGLSKNKVCFTITFKHNITNKKIHRSIEITQPTFFENNNNNSIPLSDEDLIRRIKETGGIGQVFFKDNEGNWGGDSYQVLKKNNENTLIDKETTAKNIKLMDLNFRIKKEREQEEKEKKSRGEDFQSVGDIKDVLVVGEVFGKNEDVIFYKYGKPYIVISNLLDDEDKDDDPDRSHFGGKIPSIKDFYYNNAYLQDINFHINVKYETNYDKKVENCNRLSLIDGKLVFSHIENGESRPFVNGDKQLNVIDKIKNSFEFKKFIF